MGINMKHYIMIGYDVTNWCIPKEELYEDYMDSGIKGKYNYLFDSYWKKIKSEFSLVQTSTDGYGKLIFGIIINSSKIDDGEEVISITAKEFNTVIEINKEKIKNKAKELFDFISNDKLNTNNIDGFSFVAYS